VRAAAGTTWVAVHPSGTSPCPPEAVAGSSADQTVDKVWCFEGAGGDSTWPAGPLGEDFSHYGGYGIDQEASAPGFSGYDPWHIEFDPMYRNKGITCDYSDDWMWAAKPAAGAFAQNGFDFYLTSPKFETAGWTGGLVEYSAYQCLPLANEDYRNVLIRSHLVGGEWTGWRDPDGTVLYGGCWFWNLNERVDFTPYLGADVDSIQIAWNVIDLSGEDSFSWGKHGTGQVLVDNVSIGSFDGTATSFGYREADLFADTFSRSDPAHNAYLGNAE
jgi:hypothetical protein